MKSQMDQDNYKNNDSRVQNHNNCAQVILKYKKASTGVYILGRQPSDREPLGQSLAPLYKTEQFGEAGRHLGLPTTLYSIYKVKVKVG